MIKYEERVPTLYIHNGVTNMSRSFKGLIDQVKTELRRQPKENELYVFFNAARTKAKCLFVSANGYTIVYKMLNENHFRFAKSHGYKKLTHVNPERFLSDIINSKEVSKE